MFVCISVRGCILCFVHFHVSVAANASKHVYVFWLVRTLGSKMLVILQTAPVVL